MGTRGDHGLWLVPLLALVGLGADGGEVRLIEAVKQADETALRELLGESGK